MTTPINLQPIEKQVKFEGTYEVNSIFDTIQGEGPFSGYAATFIRLAGCNLQCGWCDTEYTQRIPMGISQLLENVHAKLVVLTGGEPLRQELTPLVRALVDKGHVVQVETNGIYFQESLHVIPRVHIVISPKTAAINPKYRTEEKGRTAQLYIKRVIGVDAYPCQPDKKGGVPKDNYITHYVLPLDVQDEQMNKANERAAMKYAVDSGACFQLQIQKKVGIK